MAKSKEANGWKVATIVLAVVCIFLVVVIVLETALFIYLISLGDRLEKMETDCSSNICANYTSYSFSDSSEVCYCYSDGMVKYQQALGDSD